MKLIFVLMLLGIHLWKCIYENKHMRKQHYFLYEEYAKNIKKYVVCILINILIIYVNIY